MNDTQDKIGKLLTGREDRDAIHIAVLPAKAGETGLLPGMSVRFEPKTGEARAQKGTLLSAIGIVDPFLSKPLNRGEYFWVFLYPNTVVGMRHHWQHPQVEEPATAEKVKAQVYLQSFAEENNIDYDTLVDGLESGEVYFGDDTGAPENAYQDRSQLFAALATVTGKFYTEDHQENTHFRCAC